MIDMVSITNFNATVVALALLGIVLSFHILLAMTASGLQFEGAASVRFGALASAPLITILSLPSPHLRSGVFPDFGAILGVSFPSTFLTLWLGVLDPLFAIQLLIVFFAVIARVVKQLLFVCQAVSASALLALFAQPLPCLFAAYKKLCAFGLKGMALGTRSVAIRQGHIIQWRIIPTCLALARESIRGMAVMMEVAGCGGFALAAFSALLFRHKNAFYQLGVSTCA